MSAITAVGDETAMPVSESNTQRFERLFAQTHRFVWRSLRYLGVPAAEVEDAAQEVFMIAYRRLPEYEERGLVQGWLYGIARGVARNRGRARQRRLRRHASLAADSHTEPTAETGVSEESVDRARASRLIQQFLDSLKPKLRDVFVLVELEQTRAPEVAQQLGIPLNTVYSRLRLARGHFERFVEAHGGAKESSS